jgi:hypothetical protein
MTFRRWAAAAVLLALGAGCGGSTGGSGNATGGAGGTGSCDAFEDAPAASITSVILRNARSDAIWVSTGATCAFGPPFSLRDSSGASLPLSLDTCGNSCQELMQHGPYGCPALCAIPPVIRIDAGGSYTLDWGPSTLSTVHMPSACYFTPPSAVASCQQIVEVPAGSYEFSADAGTACPDCSCVPDATGSCESPGGTVSGTTLSANMTASLPAESVEIVFQ